MQLLIHLGLDAELHPAETCGLELFIFTQGCYDMGNSWNNVYFGTVLTIWMHTSMHIVV